MALLLAAVAISMILLALSAGLLLRADTRLPLQFRTESGRSQEEYTFRRRQAWLRQSSFLCAVLGVISLAGVAWMAIGRTH